jgi:hypothetical protein
MNPVIIIIIAVVCSVVSTAGVIMINSMVEEQNKHDEEQRNLEEAKFQQNYLEQKKEFEKQKAIAEKQQLQEEANEIARQMDASIAQSLKDKRESIEKSNMFAAPWSGSDKTVEDFLKDFRDVESTADRQKKFDAIMDEIQTNLDSINKQNSISLEEALEEQRKKVESTKFSQSLEDALEEARKKLNESQTSSESDVPLHFVDSKGNQYNWNVPVGQYDHSYPKFSLDMDDGSTQYVGDFRMYVKTSFVNVIDQVYDNSINDEDFIYEVWYIVSKLTTYSIDIGEYPQYALETLARGGGDCEDMVILIADMLRSSSHTKSWKIQMVIFDMDNIENAKTVNHVALKVDTGKESFIIEATAQDKNTMGIWGGKTINGWWIDV